MGSSESFSPPIVISRLRRLFRNRFAVNALILILIPLLLWTVHRKSPVHISISATVTTSSPPKSAKAPTTLPQHKYAYAAFLAEPENPDAPNDDDDNYFVGTRILAYQLLHEKSTKSPSNIPFLVLCTEEVTESKRARLAADGATIVPVDKIRIPWIQAGRDRWKDVLTKIRLWTLTDYERVLFLDSDMLLTRPLDSVFDDPAGKLVYTGNSTAPENNPADEGAQPSSFVVAGVAGQGTFKHPWPPRTGSEFNAGFVLLKPDKEMFEYQIRVAEQEGRFDPNYPEQALWNYIYRRGGNMPWGQLDTMSNVNRANARDATDGVLSLHVKWWKAEDETVAKLGWRLRWEMEGAAEARAAMELE
ncbi:MAG: hypothetical protein MMC23_005583 [Stictis urceolatum]|nr:hypothetical protein [Stictis urceolata]